MSDILTQRIRWDRTTDVWYPYRAQFEGHDLLIRVNSCPGGYSYTLIENCTDIETFGDWPDAWVRPP